MSVKFSFDFKNLEKDLMKSIEKDLKKHPEQVLNSHIGENIEATCPKCGCTNIKIVAGGKGKCSQCKHISNIDLNVNWR